MDEFKELDKYLEKKSAPLTEAQKEALAQKYQKEGKAMEWCTIDDQGNLASDLSQLDMVDDAEADPAVQRAWERMKAEGG